MGEGNVLRANIVAPAAADAHVVAIALFIVQNLVKHFEAHPLTILPPVAAAACHIGKAVHHAGSPDTAALTNLGILRVVQILHGKAGAGGAYEITAATVDTALVVLLPYGGPGNIGGEAFGNLHNGGVLMHLIGHHKMAGCVQIQEELVPGGIFAVDLLGAACCVDAHIIVFGDVGSHADTEATFKGMLTAHQYDLDVIPDSLVIVIRWAVP